MKNISIESSITLPCGLIVPNRIAKSAMSENMCGTDHMPGEKILNLYRIFGEGGMGLIITGNVMVDRTALGQGNNIVIEDERHMSHLTKWAGESQKNGSKLMMQINHPGRQIPRKLNKEPVAPSAIPLKSKASLMFAKPRALTEIEIENIIQRFAATAEIAKKAGFSGVQIHGAHGYLVSQFLSPLANVRTDDWGGSLKNRMKFLMEIYKAMRKKTGDDFAISVKLNSADFQRGGFSEEESHEVVKILDQLGIDLIEISGGTYEQAAMTGVNQKESTRQREAYFSEYAKKVRKTIKTPLLLTGGFRSKEMMNSALSNDEVDMIGLARPIALEPDLVKLFFQGKSERSKVKPIRSGINLIDQMGFLEIGWYTLQMERIGEGKKPDPDLSPFTALLKLGFKGF